MATNAYMYRMPSGIPGALTRDSVSTTEGIPFAPAPGFNAYGVAAKIVNGQATAIVSGDTVAVVYGLLVRPYPITGQQANPPLGSAQPPSVDGMANILKRGYMTVENTQGTPALNTPVYVRVADTDNTGHPIGSLSASQDTTTPADTPQLPNAIFMGDQDANGNVEVAYNI